MEGGGTSFIYHREVAYKDVSYTNTYHKCTDKNKINLLKEKWSFPMYTDHTNYTKVPNNKRKREIIHRYVIHL